MTRKAPINAGNIANNKIVKLLFFIKKIMINDQTHPTIKIIKSVGVKNPNINWDFFVFAGIK